MSNKREAISLLQFLSKNIQQIIKHSILGDMKLKLVDELSRGEYRSVFFFFITWEARELQVAYILLTEEKKQINKYLIWREIYINTYNIIYL